MLFSQNIKETIKNINIKLQKEQRQSHIILPRRIQPKESMWTELLKTNKVGGADIVIHIYFGIWYV